jgi:hypothetical protein
VFGHDDFVDLDSRLNTSDSVTFLDNVEAFESPEGGIGLRAARPIAANSILMSLDDRWVLDADVAVADPVIGSLLSDLEKTGTQVFCTTTPSPSSTKSGTTSHWYCQWHGRPSG